LSEQLEGKPGKQWRCWDTLHSSDGSGFLGIAGQLRICTAEDKKKLIDTHYGAIAAKAVLMKPKDLIVQEKSQEEFEKMLPGWAGLTSY